MDKPDNSQYDAWIAAGDRLNIGFEMLALIFQIEYGSGYRKKRAKSRLHKLQEMSVEWLVNQRKTGDAL